MANIAKDSSDRVEIAARGIPAEERPVSSVRLSDFGAFLGIYGGEHIAATEFVIGALLVTWGVPARELIFGLFVGNLLAASSYALVTAPIAVDTRLTLFAYLRKVMGPLFQRIYNATWGLVSIVWAASMMAISVTSLKAAIGLPVQLHWYPTSVVCVLLTLVLVLVTVVVSAYGFGGVARFSGLCVPWMAVMFFCGAAVGVPMLARLSGFGPVNGVAGFLDLLEKEVFSGAVPEGGIRLTWIHVAAFAWICGFVYHVGLNDMSIFRFARRSSYGWVGLFGMFLGHFFAWICAGVMGATAARILGTDLGRLDSGAVTQTVLGAAGLFAVVIAGWTTATPNIYRASLSFATFFPRATLRQLSFGVGAVIAAVACFPGVMRIDMIATVAALLVPPVGAICLVEHWLFPRFGFVRHWTLYRGDRINVAGVLSWGVSAAFASVGTILGWMHPFFLPIPTFLVAGLGYLIFAPLLGARTPVRKDIREHVDAVDRRVAELAEEEDSVVRPSSTVRTRGGVCRVAAIIALVVLASVSVMRPESFRVVSLVCTGAYFVFAVTAMFVGRRSVR
ncbi:MAG: cytosine permease [bacterium]|nr:cytosine permease [Candidatus Colisoma equi]